MIKSHKLRLFSIISLSPPLSLIHTHQTLPSPFHADVHTDKIARHQRKDTASHSFSTKNIPVTIKLSCMSSLLECVIYRPISVLNQDYKIYTSIQVLFNKGRHRTISAERFTWLNILKTIKSRQYYWALMQKRLLTESVGSFYIEYYRNLDSIKPLSQLFEHYIVSQRQE